MNSDFQQAFTLAANEELSQTTFDYPELAQPLTEKYKPRKIADFIGLQKAKNLCANLVKRPMPCNLFFVGPSGTGKTSLAFALAAELPAEIHHIASKECDLAQVREINRLCHYSPRHFDNWKPCKMHLVLVDEADQMSYAAQLAFLSILDGSDRPPNTIFVFTGNAEVISEDGRFMSRCQKIEFSSYGLSKEATDLLSTIWDKETDNPVERPNFARIVKESNNNVRESLMRLQTEIMSA